MEQKHLDNNKKPVHHKNLDRRVKYTKMVLKDSLIYFLEQKEPSQITIKELCEHADVNRATFYAHYCDIYDLLGKIEDELIDNIKQHLMNFELADKSKNQEILAKKIFDFIVENSKICKILLNERGNYNFQKRVMMLVYNTLFTDMTNHGIIDTAVADYVYSFIITGCIGIVQKWLNDDMKMSTTYMAQLVIQMTNSLIS